jgi:hypothetical protein
VDQHVAGTGSEVTLLGAQNRLFRLLGSDAVIYCEEAPGREAEPVGSQRGTDRT